MRVLGGGTAPKRGDDRPARQAADTNRGQSVSVGRVLRVRSLADRDAGSHGAAERESQVRAFEFERLDIYGVSLKVSSTNATR